MARNIALKKQLAGRERESVKEIKRDGWNLFCQYEGVGPDTLERWFQKQKGCEADSIFNYPSLNLGLSDLSLRDRIVLCIEAGDSQWEARLAHEKEKAEYYKRLWEKRGQQLRRYKAAEYELLEPIWEAVKPKNKGDPVRV